MQQGIFFHLEEQQVKSLAAVPMADISPYSFSLTKDKWATWNVVRNTDQQTKVPLDSAASLWAETTPGLFWYGAFQLASQVEAVQLCVSKNNQVSDSLNILL